MHMMQAVVQTRLRRKRQWQSGRGNKSEILEIDRGGESGRSGDSGSKHGEIGECGCEEEEAEVSSGWEAVVGAAPLFLLLRRRLSILAIESPSCHPQKILPLLLHLACFGGGGDGGDGRVSRGAGGLRAFMPFALAAGGCGPS